MGGRSKIESFIREKIPLGCLTNVDQIAEGALFLALDRSSFLQGMH